MDWRFLQQQVRDQAGADAGSGGARPNRRVRQLAVAAGLVAVIAVGAGWYFSSQAASPSREPSRPSLASNAVQTARDVGSFLRENVTRDIGNVAALLRRPGAAEPVEEPEDPDRPSAEADAAPSVPRTVRRRKEPTAPPEFQTGVEALPWAEVPLERPLFMVFDSSYADITPPLGRERFGFGASFSPATRCHRSREYSTWCRDLTRTASMSGSWKS